MKYGKIFTWTAIILLIAFLIYHKISNPDKNAAAEQTAAKGGKGAKPQLNLVTAYEVGTQRLANDIQAAGTILANEEVQLISEISGKITALHIKEGSKVKKGQLLLKIYDADLQAQLKKQAYQLQLAKEREGRQQKLLSINGISQEEYDITKNQVNSLEADADLLKAQISKTEIRAPFDGVIGLRYISEGSYLSPNVKIATLQQVEPLKVDFSIPEKYMNAVSNGDEIRFKIQGTNEEFIGSIYAIEPKIDLATRTVQIRAICHNKNNKILPGSFAQVRLIMKEISNAIMIPTEAVIPEMKGYKVFVEKDGKAEPQKVEIGIRGPNLIQVTKGLKVGDKVITTGIMQLKPNSPVKVISVRKNEISQE